MITLVHLLIVSSISPSVGLSLGGSYGGDNSLWHLGSAVGADINFTRRHELFIELESNYIIYPALHEVLNFGYRTSVLDDEEVFWIGGGILGGKYFMVVGDGSFSTDYLFSGIRDLSLFGVFVSAKMQFRITDRMLIYLEFKFPIEQRMNYAPGSDMTIFPKLVVGLNYDFGHAPNKAL